ncbi:AraC family transcriptional regulator [Paenibacillus sp. NPDC058174]|uniref:helix-turn-helix transcriptional regulator n=1 Tax=Paenibacillus sp. NPDC058174 TaxID=3346366 RepID=UPI0036DE52B9
MDTFNDIVAEKRTYSATQVTHSHHHAHLIMPLRGELTIAAGASHHRVNEQTLLYVSPNYEHGFYATSRNEFLVLDIPGGMVSANDMRGYSSGCEAHALNNQWKSIRHLLLHELEQQQYSRSALRDLFPYISRCLQQEKRIQPRSIQYIHEHYDQPISVQMLAELENYNRTYYSSWFMNETGKTPSAYIQEVRVNEAKKLLLNSDMPVLHIAMQVGLEHQSSLTRLFTKHEQLTPSQYRQKYRG